MFENEDKERRKVPESPEVLMERLTRIPETSGTLRKMFTSEFVGRFMGIMTSPQAVDTDWLLLCEDLTPEQADQYETASGNHNFCSQQLMGLALEMSDYFRPKLVRMVQNDMRGNSREGITEFFRNMEEFRLSRFRGIGDLRVASETLAIEFEHTLMALIGADLIDIMYEADTDERVKNKIQEFIERIDDIFRGGRGLSFPGIQFYQERRESREIFGDPDNMQCLARATTLPDLCDERWRAETRESVQNDLDFINSEVPYKRVPFITTCERDPQIIVMRDDPSGYRRGGLCAVRVNFREELLREFPAFQKNVQGRVFCDYGFVSNVVNFEVHSVKGDLCFITSGVPLTQIMSVDQYLALQYFILRKIKEYLASKDPDVEDLFTYAPKPRRKEEGELREEPLDLEVSPMGDLQPEDGAVRDGEGGAIVTEGDLAGQEISDNVLPKKFRKVVMDCMGGASAKATLGALRRMIGDEVRIHSSHHFFQSSRTGVTLPVPKHSRKSQHHISPDIILNNLKAWGYTPLEFAMELGLKIPERVLPRRSDEEK